MRRSQPNSVEHGELIRRVGLIGDVHTERATLEAVLRHFAREKLDHILCTGDLPDGPHGARDVDGCCALLGSASVLTVCGNHDRWLQDGEMRDLPFATDRDELVPETLAFLSTLPVTREFDSPAGRILLCHGLGDDDMVGVQPFDHGLALEENAPLQHLLRAARYKYVLTGHTHHPMVRSISGLTVINAGTLLSDQNPCCAIVDFEAPSIRFFDVATDGSLEENSQWAL